MPATSMSVQLITMTPDAEALIYSACKQCTSQDDAAEVFGACVHGECDGAFPIISRQDQHKLIRRVLDSGHASTVEHVSFSFAISGVSRALSHQLVRHRIASYSQQSQRYVSCEDGFEFVLPESVSTANQRANFHIVMANIAGFYRQMVAAGVPPEDARFVLPNACATKIVVTMNCRALLHFFEERTCNRAQWEIRAMAKAMLAICKDKLPVVFSNAGPKCKRLGRCPEARPCRQHVDQMAKEGGAA